MRSYLECRECSEIEAAFASPAIGRSMHLDIQGETNVASVESLSGVSQKEASLKVDLQNQSLLLHHINEEGEAREIARIASLGLPRAGSWLSVVPSPALGLHLRAAEFIPVVRYRLGLPIYAKDGNCPPS